MPSAEYMAAWLALHPGYSQKYVRRLRAKRRALGLTTAGRPRQRQWQRLDHLTHEQKRQRRQAQQRAAQARARAHIEGRVPGRNKGCRIDLGLEIASVHARRGVPMSYQELAIFCGCSSWANKLIERRALMKLRHASRLSTLKSLST